MASVHHPTRDILVEQPRTMPLFTRVHLWIFLGLLLPFSAFYCVLVNQAPDSASPRAVIMTALLTISGPFIGPISLDKPIRSTGFGAAVSPYVGGLLLICVLLQFPRSWRGPLSNRLPFWAVGWFVWFASGFLSLMNAHS